MDSADIPELPEIPSVSEFPETFDFGDYGETPVKIDQGKAANPMYQEPVKLL